MDEPASAPPPRPRRTPVALWRALPFTAQLLALGMVVGLLWFLASRVATERRSAEARERTGRLFEAQRAEVVAARLGTALVQLSRAHRGFVLTGDARYLVAYEQARRDFTMQDTRFFELRSSARSRAEVDTLRTLLAAWQDSAVRPNLALRRARGLAGFEAGTPGAARFAAGAELMDRMTLLHDALMRDLRIEVQAIESAIEEAATRDELVDFLTWAGALAVLLLLLTLLMRLVARELASVVTAADALAAGRYRDATLPPAATAPNVETAALSRAFELLAASMEQRERQLKEDVVRLTELERLKRDFVSTVSHELRTPLTSMRGALGLILGNKVGEVPTKVRDLLGIAMTNTERLIRLINDILDVEKMDAGEVTLRREPLRLLPIVQATLRGVEPFAQQHQVRLEVTSGGIDADVIGDPDRLTQVLTNLVSNAVKFSPSGAAVEVSLTPDADGVTLRVRDRGPGIPPEFAPRIFGRFQQAGGADSRRSGGTGLGLNIARGLVEQHGGRIGFEPAPGGGTVFWVSLPATVVREGSAPAPAAPVDARRAVMLIEDDPSMRGVLTALVEPLARPITAASGEEAFELLAREPVAAIVLDLSLPGMDGFEFSRRLRQDPRLRTLPVLVFSAKEYSAEELRRAGVRAADAYVKTRDAEAVLFERLRRELAVAR